MYQYKEQVDILDIKNYSGWSSLGSPITPSSLGVII